MRHLRFTKMQAYGNDYVYMDAIRQDIPDPNGLARRVSDRHFGIGSDGLVLICPSEKGEFRMRMFNPDGTEGEMCGNALRSLSKFVYDHRLTDREHFFVETLGGLQEVWLTVEGGEAVNITADIGVPRLAAAQVPVATGLERFIDQPVQVLDRTFRLSAEPAGDTLFRDAALLSAGTVDQLYLAVRLAICELVLPQPNGAPIILDDALANFDDGRCAAALRWLRQAARTRQILLFTCHSREADLLAGDPDVSIQRLTAGE